MQAIIEYVREEWPEALQDMLGKTADAIVNSIVWAPMWFSGQIEDWSHRTLPPASAKVATAAIEAIPLIALNLFAPPAITVSIHVALAVGRVADRAFVHSVGLAGIVACVLAIADGIFEKNPLTLFWATSAIFGGLGFLHRSGFIEDIVEARAELGSVYSYTLPYMRG